MRNEDIDEERSTEERRPQKRKTDQETLFDQWSYD